MDELHERGIGPGVDDQDGTQRLLQPGIESMGSPTLQKRTNAHSWRSGQAANLV
jgi:hypothetical protein